MSTLLNGYSTLKKSAVGFSLYRDGTGPRTLDLYTLAITDNPLDRSKSIYCVHIERREENGTIQEGYFYRGDDLNAANEVFRRYAGGAQ